MANFDTSAMLSFDLETTSANPKEARIVTSAMVRIQGRNVEPQELLADPGVEIPEEATKVHGITTEYARTHGKPHQEVLEETIRQIQRGWDDGLTLIVFNAAYDLSVLRSLTGDFLVTGPVYDPFVIDRQKDPYRKGSRTLGALAEFYGVRLDNAHEATSDALAAARIAWKQIKLWPDLAKLELDELMERQSVWYYERQASFQRYLQGQGKDPSTVNTAWPMMS
ncbi:3'-5' exonuclease [Corynebacterium freiburgense]|uniref:3'-5' exonuclease n=1 Tax=Corynebacterium freiburgense TaxID=556548 RepID=UPI0004212489|nr:3'-5' exonuclease [Corynebacterium freiburgense]WJZ02397.1 DNA polymerase III subunit epsilon [Corynebacterium freiburgense]